MPDRRPASRAPSRGTNEANAITQEALLADIATWYYVDRMTQSEIARQIGKSVATVSRLLAKAEAAEIVEVRVRYPVPVVPALQAALVKRFGLRTARVARVSTDDSRSLVPQISDLAARHISTLLSDGSILAVAWGATVHGVIYAITAGQQRDVHVVQGVGSLGSRLPTIDNPLLIQVLAERIDATPHYLPAPMIVESVAVRDALSRDPHFKATLDLGGRADIALVGIGQAEPQGSGLVRAGYLEPWAMERIRASGAVGDMMVEFYDITGQIVETDIQPRVMGMREAELRQARSVVAVAGGSAKVPAILGALRTGLIHTLVTDNMTARQVLEMDDEFPVPRHVNHEAHRATARTPAQVRRHDAAIRQLILDTTMSLLERDGYQRLSIDSVVGKSAVEQQSIYRWWENKAALARDAVADNTAPPLPGSNNLPNLPRDLAVILTAVLFHGRDRDEGLHRAHRSMTAEAQLDPEFHRLYRDLHRIWRDALVQAIERGRSRGEIASSTRTDTFVDMLLGALWYRLLLDPAPLDTAFLHDLIAAITGSPTATEFAS